MRGLAELGGGFRRSRVRLILIQDGLRVLCLRLFQRGLGGVEIVLRHLHRGIRLVDLIDGHVFLLEQRFNTVEVVGGVLELGLGGRGGGLSARDGSLGQIDAAASGLNARPGTVQPGASVVFSVMCAAILRLSSMICCSREAWSESAC